MVSQEFLDLLGLLDHLVKIEALDDKVPLDQAVEGSSTSGGGRALVHKAQSYSTLESLEGPSTLNQGVEQITSACLRIQSTASPSHSSVVCKDMPMCMGQSMKALYMEQIIIMFPVQCIY